MSRIAIIDTYTDPKYVTQGALRHIPLCEDSITQADGEYIHHGSVCALVLDRCTNSPYELLNIQALPNKHKAKVFGSIDDLHRALNICIEENVDIVSMSLASSVLSDSRVIYDTAKALAEKAVIVAALDNMMYVSLPTSYPFVVGVQNDWDNLLEPGDISYKPEDSYCAHTIANCNFGFLRDIRHYPSNSFAVPVVTAWVNDILNREKLSPQAVMERLRAKPVYTGGGLRFSDRGGDIPVAVLIYENDDSPLPCRKVLDGMFKEEIQATALSVFPGEYDVRIRRIDSAGNIPRELRFMQAHYKTDIIFVAVRQEELSRFENEIEIDLLGRVNGDVIEIECEEQTVTVPTDKAAETIYNLLSEDGDEL